MIALRLFIITLFFSLNAIGAENGYAVNTFTCSDGAQYNAVRYVSGERNDQGWTFVAVCDPGTVSQTAYAGEVVSINEAHEDIQACANQQQADDRDDIRRCNDEFIDRNGLRGIEGQRIVGASEGLAQARPETVATRMSKPSHLRNHDRRPRTAKAMN